MRGQEEVEEKGRHNRWPWFEIDNEDRHVQILHPYEGIIWFIGLYLMEPALGLNYYHAFSDSSLTAGSLSEGEDGLV